MRSFGRYIEDAPHVCKGLLWIVRLDMSRLQASQMLLLAQVLMLPSCDRAILRLPKRGQKYAQMGAGIVWRLPNRPSAQLIRKLGWSIPMPKRR